MRTRLEWGTNRGKGRQGAAVGCGGGRCVVGKTVTEIRGAEGGD